MANKKPVSELPSDLGFFFAMISNDYLPYMQANADAVVRGDSEVKYRAQGENWTIPVAPYRARCLNDLKAGYLELDDLAQEKLAALLSESAVAILKAPFTETKRASRIVGRLGTQL